MKTAGKYLFWIVVCALAVTCSAWVPAIAHADPGYLVDPQAATYAAGNGERICAIIKAYPSVVGVAGVVEGIVAEGLTGSQAGTAIAISVTAVCPQYWPVLNAFIAETSLLPATPPTNRHLVGTIA